MGTNFYAESEPCPHCGKSSDKLHLGKSSGGWKFALRAHKDLGIDSLRALVDYIESKDMRVLDEYGLRYSLAQFVLRVADRSPGNLQHPDPVRSGACWDLIDKEFS